MVAPMIGWETDPRYAAMSPIMPDFAQIWQAADKIASSRKLKLYRRAGGGLSEILILTQPGR